MTRSAPRIAIKVLPMCLFCFFGLNLRAQDAPKPALDYAKEAFVVQHLLNKIQFENDGSYTLGTTAQVRVQSASGIQAWGLIQVPYASNEGDVTITGVKITKPDGRVVSTPLDDIQDTPAPITVQAPFYSDVKIKQLAVRGLEVGDTLEYGHSIHVRNPLIPGQFWFARDFFKDGIVLEEQFEIRVPRDRYVKVQSPKLAPTSTDENGYRLYVWKAANLKSSSEEEKTKAAESLKDSVPDVQITSFRSWDEVAQWYQQLEASRLTPSPEIKTKAEEITRGAASDNEKARLIYNYVAAKFRYIGIAFGIGRYQPHAAADVLANGYGDCKDKHTLLAALLAAAGIRSSAVLINSARKLDPDVPSPGQFDHMITAIPQGKDLLWMDSTSEVGPLGYLIPALRDKQALMVPDAGPPQLVRTPADPPFASSFIFKIDGKLGSDSVLDAKVDSSFRGDTEYVLRAAFRSTSQTQWKDIAQAIARLWNFSGTVSDVEVSLPEATDAPFSLKYAYNRKDYPNWPDALNVPLPPINLTKLADDDKSSDPIRLELPGEYRVEANIELPKNVAANPRAAVDITKDFAEYHASYSWQAGVFHVQRRLIIRLQEVPRSRSEEYRSFWKAISDEGDRVISVSSSAPASSEKNDVSSAGSSDARANQLLDLGDSFFRQGNYDDAIAQFRKALSLRADDVRAHRTLGDVLYNKKEFDGASAEYREALRLNPQDSGVHRRLGDVLYNQNDLDGANEEYLVALRLNPEDGRTHRSLGDALWFGKDDVDGAEGQYHEALRIDPADAEAHHKLGDLFFFKKNYTGAIAEYREFMRLSPNDPEAHDSLAEGLFNKPDLDGAVAEYQAALRLKPEDPRAHAGLGDILLRRGHAQEAVEELKKATGTEGVPPFAYESLGRAYVSLHRYDEAIEALQQAKRRLPWKPEESLGIASLFIEQKRYAEAIAELQPATERYAKYAPLEFMLGRALLRAGEAEKSVPAFQKAVELDSTPAMLNGVSYELAEASVDLDDALSYAGRAVEQQEAKAAGISLGNLTPADPRLMPALAAEWDTLGWVHYRLGHMDEAEKYIGAAWKLAQFPDIGDHLGLIYERTGRKEQAIRLYKMTLATRHAPAETTDRLSALLGSKPTSQAVDAAVEDLMQVRTVKLPRLTKGQSEAEFFVIITPDAGITAVRFISGSEELRSAGGALASAHYDFNSPDGHPVKLLRRGILDCAAVGTDCEFVFLPPESVNSLN